LQFSAYTADVDGSNIQTLLFPGIGVPKAVRIDVSGGSTNATNVDHARIGRGYWVANGDFYRSVSVFAQDSSANPNSGGIFDTATIIQVTNTTSAAMVAEADIHSVGNGWIKLRWLDYPGTVLLLSVTAYYGDVQCNLHDFTPSASVDGTATTSGLAFAPNCLELLHINDTAWSADGTFNTMGRLGIGYSVLQEDDTTILQGGVTVVDRDNPTTVTGCGQVLRNNRIAQKLTVNNAGTVTAGALLEVTAYTSDGYTIATRVVAESIPCVIFAVEFGDGERWCGVPALVTSSTGVKSVAAAPGFSPAPIHVDCIGTMIQTVNTVESGTQACHLSLGGGQPGQESCSTYQTEDGILLGTSDTRSRANAVVAELIGDGGAVSWRGSLDLFTGSGFDIEIEVASTNDELALFLVVGGADVQAFPGQDWLAHVARRRHQTVLWGTRKGR